MVPAYDHAFDKPLAPFALRVEACRLQAEVLGPWCRVEPIEAELPAPSYTIRTLDELASRHPSHRFRWVMGADVLETLHLWKDWRRIWEEYPPLIVGRAGYPPVAGAPTFPDFSSSAVRDRLLNREPFNELLLTEVRELVLRHRDAFLS